jgi:hypothetical protein
MKRLLPSFPLAAFVTLSLLAVSGCSILPTPRPKPTGTLPIPVATVYTDTPGVPTAVPPSATPAPTAVPPTVPAPTVAAPTVAPTVAPTATPLPSSTVPAPTPLPIKTIPIPATRQAINFLPKTVVYALTANLVAGTPQAYTLNIGAGQHVFFTRNGNAVVQVSRPDGTVIVPPISQPGPWEVVASQKGDYIVVLKGAGAVTLGIYIPPATTTSLVPAPVPTPLQSIAFQKDAISAAVVFTLTQGTPQAFTLSALKGQLVSVLTSGSTTLSWLSPDGSLLLPTLAIPSQWQFALPQTGANTLVFIGQGMVQVTITIPPAAPPAGAMTPASRKRISFAPEDAATTFTTTLASGSPQGYVLTVLGGQRIYISATGQAQVQVLGAGDAQLKTLGGVGLWAVDASQTGDYTVVVFGTGATTVTIFVPPL